MKNPLDSITGTIISGLSRLTLSEEPKANVTRYDHLRGRRHVG